MELELGLALPISAHFPTQAYHLDQPQLKNATAGGLAMEFKNLMMITQRQKLNQKRSFSLAFDDGEVEDDDPDSKTLSLLVWNGRRPNNHDDDDDDDGEGHMRKPLDTASQKYEDEDQIVGWPPIRSWRKKLLLRDGGGGGHGHRIGADHRRAADNYNNGGGRRNSIFVKVKMEGVMIGRKIDLMLFNSYQALTTTLLNMFAKYRKGDKDDGPYILSYLDKDGDWLLAGDVPWQTFINSVHRMEILKRRN